jgi:hypothetical protein
MDRDDVDTLLDDLWRPTRLDFSILALFLGVCPSHLKLVLPPNCLIHEIIIS